jgi:hypothetical protein
VQAVEIGPAVNPEQHGFTIDHTECGLSDQRESIVPVMAIPGPQPNTLASPWMIRGQPSCLISFVPRLGMQGSNGDWNMSGLIVGNRKKAKL